MKILIVEDEMIISEDIAMMLEECGYAVVGQAVNYDEAIAVLEKEKPDLAVLDINLQGSKDGIDVATKINEMGPIPFIYSSSLGDPATIARAKKTNPSAYLVKPFKEEQLFAAIEVAMSNFRLQEKNNNEEERLPVFNDSIFVKDGHRYQKVKIADICYIHKSDNYLDIHTKSKRYIVRSSITGFLDQLNDSHLFRTHKSYAVNLDFVTGVYPNHVLLDETEIPLARSYADSLKSHLRIF